MSVLGQSQELKEECWISVEFSENKNKSKENEAQEKRYERDFENRAEEAFQKVRQHADLFINLLILMLVSGMEELNLESIKHIKRVLFLDASEEEARLMFKNVIQKARKSVGARKFDNFFHAYNNKKKDKKMKDNENKIKEKK